MAHPKLIAALFAAAAIAAAQPKPDFAELEKIALEELKSINAPGAEIAVVQGDRVVYAKGFGVADVETGAPMTPDLLCRVGSTTKMLTAAVLAGLAEDGKLKLDEPVGNYIQGLSLRIARLTADELLSHTAGLRDEAQMYGLHDDSALGAFVRSWKDDMLFAEPRSIYSYSNAGYHLAGLLIEEVGGKPYADMMAERLFKPLGMQRTTLRPVMAMTYPLAQGHDAKGKQPPTVIRPFADNAANWPAGSVFTSASEFARFAIAFLNDGRIGGKQALSPAVIARLSTPHASVPGEAEMKYGYGLMVGQRRGVRILEHGGSRSGYGSLVRMAPEQRFAVIALVNRSGGALMKTVEKATEMFLPLGPKPAPRPKEPLPMSADEMASCAGVYKNGANVAEVFVKDGKLFSKQFGFTMEVIKIGEDRLAVKPPGAPEPQEIVVVRGSDGKPRFLFRAGRALRRAEP